MVFCVSSTRVREPSDSDDLTTNTIYNKPMGNGNGSAFFGRKSSQVRLLPKGQVNPGFMSEEEADNEADWSGQENHRNSFVREDVMFWNGNGPSRYIDNPLNASHNEGVKPGKTGRNASTLPAAINRPKVALPKPASSGAGDYEVSDSAAVGSYEVPDSSARNGVNVPDGRWRADVSRGALSR